MQEKTRNLQFDVARAIAVLYIVGYHHLLSGYVDSSIHDALTNDFTRMLVNPVLGLFMFLSGFFLSKYSFFDSSSVLFFYRKRFLRFYPLFFIAALGMFMGGMIKTLPDFLKAVTGLSVFFPPQPMTLWFLSMLLVFYLLTPIISPAQFKITDTFLMKMLKTLSGGALLFLLILVLSLYFETDTRIYWCFPCYWLGLVLGRSVDVVVWTKKPFVGLFSLFVVFCLVLSDSYRNYGYLFIFAVGVFILFLCYYLSLIINKSVIGFISYSSMCAYLFHRHIYKAGQIIIGSDYFNVWIAYIVVLPAIFVLSWLIQKSYDSFSKRIHIV